MALTHRLGRTVEHVFDLRPSGLLRTLFQHVRCLAPNSFGIPGDAEEGHDDGNHTTATFLRATGIPHLSLDLADAGVEWWIHEILFGIHDVTSLRSLHLRALNSLDCVQSLAQNLPASLQSVSIVLAPVDARRFRPAEDEASAGVAPSFAGSQGSAVWGPFKLSLAAVRMLAERGVTVSLTASMRGCSRHLQGYLLKVLGPQLANLPGLCFLRCSVSPGGAWILRQLGELPSSLSVVYLFANLPEQTAKRATEKVGVRALPSPEEDVGAPGQGSIDALPICGTVRLRDGKLRAQGSSVRITWAALLRDPGVRCLGSRQRPWRTETAVLGCTGEPLCGPGAAWRLVVYGALSRLSGLPVERFVEVAPRKHVWRFAAADAPILHA